MNVLFVGDIVGKPGRAAVRHFVPALRRNCSESAPGTTAG